MKDLFVTGQFVDLTGHGDNCISPLLWATARFRVTAISPGGQAGHVRTHDTAKYIDVMNGRAILSVKFNGTEYHVAMGEMALDGSRTMLWVDNSEGAEIRFLFRLTSQDVAKLESLRAGQKPLFRLTARLDGGAPATQIGGRSEEGVGYPFSTRVPITTGRSSEEIPIDKSRWAEEILPHLGYGRSRVFEIPLADEKGLEQAEGYLLEADKRFRAGDWKDCMARCRDAIQALQPYLEKYANPAYADKRATAAEKTGAFAASFETLTGEMLRYQAKLFSLLSAGSHPEAPGTSIERADAEFAFMTSLACLRYVSRLMRAERGT